ncbi:MAG: anti-sigma factor antagonist [Micromonosporaceae bacterium]
MGLEVSLEPLGDGRMVLRISGELDMSTRDPLAQAMRSVLAGDGTTLVIVDLSATRFLDASGIGALMQMRGSALAAGANLVVREPREMVATVLRITRADEILCTASPAVSGIDGGGDPHTPPGPDGPG